VRKRLYEPRERPHGHAPDTTSTPAHHAMPSRLATGDKRSRWTAAGMLEVERQSRNIIGDQHLAWLAVGPSRSVAGRSEVLPRPRSRLVTMRFEGEVRMRLLGRLPAEVLGLRGDEPHGGDPGPLGGDGPRERTAAQRAGRRHLRRQTATTVVAAR
jgi:hypothetical protein